MTDLAPPDSLSAPEAAELLRSLLHKEEDWIAWGRKCQRLQKAGYHSQQIFEQTGFQTSQQNLVIVAAQVYESMEVEGAEGSVLSYYQGPRADVLYELRILNQKLRLGAAIVAMEKRLEAEGAKTLAKAIQDFSRFTQPPSGFSHEPGDAMAYWCWQRARQKRDLADRTRLIAQGLKFAQTAGAREKLEQLLGEGLEVTKAAAMPLLPLHRLEAAEEMPRLVTLVGDLPLTLAQWQAAPMVSREEPFAIAHIADEIRVVPLPGWPSVLQAQEPLAIREQSDRLPKPLNGKPQMVLLVVDRAHTTWDPHSYFLAVGAGESLTLQWFEREPAPGAIVGKLVMVLRPKNILDEGNITEPWQMDD